NKPFMNLPSKRTFKIGAIAQRVILNHHVSKTLVSFATNRLINYASNTRNQHTHDRGFGPIIYMDRVMCRGNYLV
ncbi:hypothetical protein, partial [Klebsiella pneumoniae]|uniref:hypothetical protein n=1 Tax=Klebsiella pneumoniae TaxID=573 RepID=UPI0038528D7F